MQTKKNETFLSFINMASSINQIGMQKSTNIKGLNKTGGMQKS